MISVIIPVYNAQKYLLECVSSVRSQTYPDLQIILINDDSTDSSGAICDTLTNEDSRIQVIHQPNRGVSAARNAGLKAATGDLISFIDADDTLDPDMYEYLIRLLEEYDADIAHCAYRHIVGEEVRLIHDTKQIYPQTREEALYRGIKSFLDDPALLAYYKEKAIERGKSFRTEHTVKAVEDMLLSL